MSARFEFRRFLGFVFTAMFLVTLLTPLLDLVPTARGVDGWWNDGWPYRKAITINNTEVDGILENFPVLLNITDSDLIKAQQDGDDLVFIDSNTGLKLDHEIEYFDHDAGHLVAWVKMPLLANTTATELYMYYGNPSAESQQNPANTWDSLFLMVQHLRESVGTRYDSTGNGNNVTPYGGVSKSPSGKIDGADSFDGVDDHLRQTTLSLFGRDEITIESWIYVNSVPAAARYAKTHMYGKSLPVPPSWYGLWIGLPNVSPTDRFIINNRLYNPQTNTTKSFSHTVFLVDQWVHVAWGLSKLTNRAYFYVNGELARSDDISSLLATGFITPLDDPAVAGFSMGSSINWQERTKMMCDEARISKIVRSSNWILTSYNNQKNPSTFYILGEEERLSNLPPFVSEENPKDGATDVYTNPELSVRITDVDGDPMAVYFRTNATGMWQDIKNYTNAEDGTYTCIPDCMNMLGTKYYWSIHVTDGDSWTNKTCSFTTTSKVLRYKWESRTRPSTGSVLIADIDGNGLEEVVHAGEGGVSVLNGTDGSIVWSVQISGAKDDMDAQMADLNKDGILEIIVPIKQPGGIHVLYGNNGSTFWRNTKGLGFQTWNSPVIGDIDGDGYPTIFVACMSELSAGLNGTGRLTSLSWDGQIINQTYIWRPCAGGLSLADTEGDGEFEVYMCDRNAYFEFDGGWGKGVQSFWARNLTRRWSRPDILCSSHIPMLADVNKDGILDVIVGHHRGGIAVLNSTDGSAIRIITGIPDEAPIHYQSSVYDIDNDGNLEIMMADGSHSTTTNDIVIWDLVDWKVDARFYVGNSYYGPTIAEVTGDGIMEIIALNYSCLFIFNNNYSMIDNATGLTGWLTYAVVQDIDGDQYNELVVTSTYGVVYAYDTPARRTTPRPRSEVQFYSERRLGAAEYVPPPGGPAPVISAPSPLDGATSMSVMFSQLGFSLTDFQYDLMNYTVTTTPNIGSDSRVNIRNGRYAVAVGNLEHGTTYTWKVSVTDGENWANKTFTFTTEAPTWWNTSWQYRRTIAIDPTRVSSDQTNFPILIDLTDTNLASRARSDGYDFIFIEPNNIKLSHEIELYDSTTGHLVTWVNIPFLSSTTYTKIYMYYGNPNATDQQDHTAVWDPSLKIVLHLNEETGSHYDSSINGNAGTPYGGIAQGVTGKIDGADNFDGINDYIEVPHSNSITGFTAAFTASFWIKLEDTTRRQAILNKYDSVGNQRAWFIEFQTHATYGKVLGLFLSKDGVSWREYYVSFNPAINEWYYIVVVWESGKVPKFYINSVQVSTIGIYTISSIFNNTGAPLHIGRSTYTTGRYLKGALDEIHISNVARSADWISTSYNNHKDPSNFYTIGIQETLPEEPIVTAPSPFDGAANVPTSLSQLSFCVTDYQGALMNYTVTTYPNIGSGNATNVSNGKYTLTVSNLDYDTTYTWFVNVTDGITWANKTFTFTSEPAQLWWNTSWQCRKTITINPAEVSSDQTFFPVLVELTDIDLASKAQPDGDDIIFIYSNNIRLSHEIELYDSTIGRLVAWVKIPFLSSTTYTRIHMYYGNPNAINQQDHAAVWDSSSKMVLHLNEETGLHYDSTINSNNGTPYGGIAQGVGGKIDGADNFDGINDYIEVPHSDGITGFTAGFTASFWLRLDDTTRRQTILNKYSTGGNQRAWFIEFQTHATYGKVLGLFLSKDGVGWREYYVSFNPAISEWYYIVVVWESGKVPKIYINGQQKSTIGKTTITSIFNNTLAPLHIGRSTYAAGRYLKGMLDEIRISSVAYSAALVLTCYNNQKEPSSFYTIGIQETLPEGPVITSPSPLNGATRLPLELNRLSFNLVNYGGKTMNYTVVTGPDIGSDSGNNVFDGRYSISISNLAPSTTYRWTVNATDGTSWTNQTYMFTTSPGAPPTQDNPLLISSGGTNKTDEDLICYNQTTYDPDDDKITNIYNWYRNDTSVTNLLLPFNTNSSTIAKDYSGYSNNGVIVGGVTWTIDGKVGGAYKFDTGYIQIPGTSTLDGGGQWSEITVEQWIYLTTYRSGTRTIAKIPSYEIGISWNKIFAGIWIDTGVSNVTGYNRVTYDTPLQKNTWYHIAFTYKSGTGLTLYVNGIAVADIPVSGNIQTSGTEPICLGWFDYFKGIIDEVRIYPKSLSPQQIYQRYVETKDGLSNNSTIVRGEIEVGDIWKCQVTPNDFYQDGAAKFSNAITIVENNPPSAYNLTITPSTPYTNDSLEANYTYFDPDGDPESGTEIRWYRNGILQPELDDTLIVTYNLTTKGDIWYFTVRPNDGKAYGTIQNSQSVAIQNSLPTIDSFSPENTTLEISEGEIIQFTHTSSDLDDDTLTYLWLLDGTEQSTTQNWTYQATTPGTFNITLVVSDGELFASQQWKLSVNAPPNITSYYPSDDPTIFEGQSQEFNVTYFDPDGDPLTIQWYVNGSLVEPSPSDSYTYEADVAGIYIITVIVSDGLAQTSHQWTLAVKQPET